MWCRRKIDIRWSDLLTAFWWSLWPTSPEAAARDAESSLFDGDEAIATLSVRSGLDLLLQCLDWPRGSEILISAVTIPDIPKIIASHGLIPVPVPVDVATMFPTRDQIEARISPRTRAILIAHLFGAIHDVDPLAELADQHQLLLLEDCAQAFEGTACTGHPNSDVVMFSFGPIKTATALGGGILLVRDSALRHRIRHKMSSWPLQSRLEFFRRVLRFGLLKLVSGRLVFGSVMRLLRLFRQDPDAVLNGTVRGFPGHDLINRLRRRPASALLKLVARRLRNFDTSQYTRRARSGAEMFQAIEQPSRDSAATGTGWMVPGGNAKKHSWWVFPLTVPDETKKNELLQVLRTEGFDASGSSQLVVLESDNASECLTTQCRSSVLSRTIFPPLYPEMSEPEQQRLTATIRALQVE